VVSFSDEYRRWTHYIGVGAGITIPHVDVETTGSKTFEYQLTGPAIQLIGGVHYSTDDRWGSIGAYNGTYSQME
jgi:lipid A oxidase